MPDPRNIAHDKKVQDEKKAHHEEVVPGAIVTPQPGKKPPVVEKVPIDDGHIEHHRHHVPNTKGDEAEPDTKS